MNFESTPGSPRSTTGSTTASKRRSAAHDSSAFIVRFWEEPREGGGAPVMRGYIKHLKTGREQYFSDLAEVPRILGTDLETEAVVD